MFWGIEKITGQFLIDNMHLRMVYGLSYLKISEITLLDYGLAMKDFDR